MLVFYNNKFLFYEMIISNKYCQPTTVTFRNKYFSSLWTNEYSLINDFNPTETV